MILIGAGNLGGAIAAFINTSRLPYRVLGAFDIDSSLFGKTVGSALIHPMEEMPQFISDNHVDIAVLTVPRSAAVQIAQTLTACGIRAIWNFAHVDLPVPAGIPVEKKNYRELRKKAGVVFQNPDDQLFLPRIRDNVAFGLKNLGVSPEETDRRVQNILQQFNIPELSGRLSMKLSGGEKRLAALASVMVMEPEVLLLDEPTAFLDPKARRNLIRILKRLPQTMLIATHDLSFAAEVCPRAVLLSRGMLIAEKATEEIDEDLIS